MKRNTIKKLAACGMLCAAAYVVTVAFRFPVFPSAEYLKLDFKDTVIALGGFIYGPAAACVMAVVTALAEMLTVSESGLIGFVMNAVGSAAFAGTASLIYKYRRSIGGTFAGLGAGCASMTAFMLLWNYLITPFYTGAPRAAVAALLIPVILPFNILKSVMNAALTLVLYAPLTAALKKASLLPPGEDNHKSSRLTLLVVGTGAAAVLICTVIIIFIKL